MKQLSNVTIFIYMKCPIDKTEMEKGELISHGSQWEKNDSDKKGFFDKLTWNFTPVFAYRCPKCGKVELTTETK